MAVTGVTRHAISSATWISRLFLDPAPYGADQNSKQASRDYGAGSSLHPSQHCIALGVSCRSLRTVKVTRSNIRAPDKRAVVRGFQVANRLAATAMYSVFGRMIEW